MLAHTHSSNHNLLFIVTETRCLALVRVIYDQKANIVPKFLTHSLGLICESRCWYHMLVAIVW